MVFSVPTGGKSVDHQAPRLSRSGSAGDDTSWERICYRSGECGDKGRIGVVRKDLALFSADGRGNPFIGQVYGMPAETFKRDGWCISCR